MSDIRVVRAMWPEDEAKLHAIRHQVFVQEQGVDESIEWDGQDAKCVHVLAYRHNDVVGTGRLMPNGKIGRMAVLKASRGLGIGALLLKALVDVGHHAGFLSLYLHAQAQAAGFYTKLGFNVDGESYQEAGIEHVTMMLSLPPRDSAITPSAFASNRLAIIQCARREIYVFEPDFSLILSELADMMSAMTTLLRNNPRSEIFVLSLNSTALIERCPEFFTWLQRLNSRVHYRVVTEADATELGAMWLSTGFAVQGKHSKGLAMAPAASPALETQLQAYKRVWQRSETDKRFRRLMI